MTSDALYRPSSPSCWNLISPWLIIYSILFLLHCFQCWINYFRKKWLWTQEWRHLQPVYLPLSTCSFFRLLVTTIIQHGRINGHIGSYSSRRGRPKIICRGTATGNEWDDASHSETAINYALLFSFHWRVYAQGIAYHCCIQDAKQDDISAHFQSFGELDNINLKTAPATGRSRRGVVYAPVSTAQAEGEMFNV